MTHTIMHHDSVTRIHPRLCLIQYLLRFYSNTSGLSRFCPICCIFLGGATGTVALFFSFFSFPPCGCASICLLVSRALSQLCSRIRSPSCSSYSHTFSPAHTISHTPCLTLFRSLSLSHSSSSTRLHNSNRRSLGWKMTQLHRDTCFYWCQHVLRLSNLCSKSTYIWAQCCTVTTHHILRG